MLGLVWCFCVWWESSTPFVWLALIQGHAQLLKNLAWQEDFAKESDFFIN
jgi:hypothetical protein